jgi:hypothetical protein
MSTADAHCDAHLPFCEITAFDPDGRIVPQEV